MNGAWVRAVSPFGPAMQEGFVPAAIGRRVAAWLIDFALILVVVFATEWALGRRHCEMRWDVTPLGTPIASYFCYLGTTTSNEAFAALYSGIYSVVLWRLTGATLAQRLFRIRVYALEEPRPLPLWRGIVRWAVLWGWLGAAIVAGQPQVATIAEAVLLIWLIGLFRSALADRRLSQGWHDRLARSVAVKRDAFWVGPRRFDGSGGMWPRQ